MSPESIVAEVMLAALILYAVLGGADFGAGVWEFNLGLRADERDRRLIAAAIGPVWEANHVWLIFVLMLLANGFPGALAALSRALWLPLLLSLVGIVFRGASFAFHSYSVGAARQKQAWEAVFALASTLTPFFMGAAVGAIASGSLAVGEDGRFSGSYFTGWISPLSIFTAFFSVGMCAYLAAFYLSREAHLANDAALVDVWRRRALLTGAGMGLLALAGLVLVAATVPVLWSGFKSTGWPLVLASLLGGFTSLWSIWHRRFNLAVLCAAGAVAAVIAGWGLAQYPVIIQPAVTLQSAKAPDNVLRAMLISVGLGTLVLAPSLAWLFAIFKAESHAARDAEDA